MSARTRCAKHVFSGARHDMGGHRCGHYAVEGSDFCHIHQAAKTMVDTEPEAELSPARTASSTRRTYYASLEWEPGQGPLVRPPYRLVGMGFVTKALAKATDDQEPSVSVWGVMRKKDGTPGIQTWDATFRSEELLPPASRAQLLALLEEERRG